MRHFRLNRTSDAWFQEWGILARFGAVRIGRVVPESGSARIALALAIGIAAAALTYWSRALIMVNHGASRYAPTDFAQLWFAARAWLDGIDPYSVVGPGKAFEWDFPLLYPMPAVLVAVPFTWLSLPVADAVFVGVGCALFGYAVTRHGLKAGPRWAFGSLAFIRMTTNAQWSALITGAALVPSAGFLLACKPTVGAALWCAYPSRKALIGAGLFGLLSVAVYPSWVGSWLAALPTATHMTPPLFRPGGFVLLLALLRWRHADGRLLLGLSLVPHSPLPYEVIPLFLLVRTMEEGVLLSAGTVIWHYAILALQPFDGYAGWALWNSRCELWLLYLPALGIVLWRWRGTDRLQTPGERNPPSSISPRQPLRVSDAAPTGTTTARYRDSTPPPESPDAP
jgi:hypothetical protein